MWFPFTKPIIELFAISFLFTSCGYDSSSFDVTSVTVEHHEHWGDRYAISATTNVERAHDKTPDAGFAVSDEPIAKCTHENSQVHWASSGMWIDVEPGKTYHIRACYLRDDGTFSKGKTKKFTAK